MQHWNDEQLVSAYLDDGNQKAFGLLVTRHKERIFGYLYGMVQNHEIANDLFQDTFLRVIAAMQEKRASYDNRGRWIYWVLRIARNAALDHLRSRKKWVDVDGFRTEDGDTSYWDSLAADAPSALEGMQNEEKWHWIEKCIEELPPEQREVLLMRHEAELSFKEIAELTDCSINTALGRMRYALLNVQKILSKYHELEAL
jgi:RNA polymerase sigma-70 factor, ECF subfamily